MFLMFEIINEVIMTEHVESWLLFVYIDLRPLLVVGWDCLSQMHVVYG
jgi:hypothetical protein